MFIVCWQGCKWVGMSLFLVIINTRLTYFLRKMEKRCQNQFVWKSNWLLELMNWTWPDQNCKINPNFIKKLLFYFLVYETEWTWLSPFLVFGLQPYLLMHLLQRIFGGFCYREWKISQLCNSIFSFGLVAWKLRSISLKTNLDWGVGSGYNHTSTNTPVSIKTL